MDFTVLTIFPGIFNSFLEYGIIRRAILNKKINVLPLNIREFATDKHSATDDRPYGGGPGMVMKPEPLSLAIKKAKEIAPLSKTILLTPQGKTFNQDLARSFSNLDGLILICSRYEGPDERICYNYIDEEISIGDYVLTGGEIAAMIIIDAVTRLIPGTLGAEDSAEKDSFTNNLLDHANYTRPRSFEGEEVPEVLLSGNHLNIFKWRLEDSLIRTFLKRPDLLEQRLYNREEVEILKKWCKELDRIIQTQSIHSSFTLSCNK
ncbi:MAG: tRNA (guanosine(37)-N1)-methyltransferase TrmD [Desulfobacterales bacterium]|nr:tRNA (guanosine(37)-N1)-methyltransferase TrmD [Desulfobacterales bacterium]MBF0396714.1 tRNA (guanosine(37)-N1)-methyltransferase TrmD [Desulfobacterales bacterium]